MITQTVLATPNDRARTMWRLERDGAAAEARIARHAAGVELAVDVGGERQHARIYPAAEVRSAHRDALWHRDRLLELGWA